MRDQLGELLGVADGRQGVLRPGDHQGRHADRLELEAQVLGRIEDRTDLSDERLGRLLEHDARDQVHPDPEPLPQPRPDEPFERLVAERGHPTLVHRVGPFLQQLATPRVVATGSARQHQRAGAVRVEHPDDLRDHAAHRRANHVGSLDALGVEDRERVQRHLLEGVPAVGPVAAPGAPVVERVTAELAAEGEPLQGPAPRVRAESLDHQQRRTITAAEDVVVDRDIVTGHDLRHRSPLRARTDASTVLANRESTLDPVPPHSVRTGGSGR